jgi:type IV pilus assembly protein PilB
MARKRLGETLKRHGKISDETLERAVQEQPGQALLLGELLLKQGLVTKKDLSAALEEINRVPYLDPASAVAESEALASIPYSEAQRHCALPLRRTGRKLLILMASPQDLQALNELSFVSGLNLEPRFAFREEIYEAIQKAYQEDVAELAAGATASFADIEFVSASSNQRTRDAVREFQAELQGQNTPAVRLVSTIIAAAMEGKASDIHIDPQGQGALVRIRVDGILRDLMRIPRHLQEPVISRIKILADLDIAERRAPQDGRLFVSIGSDKRDLRVATLPIQYGEKIVIRLLDSRSAVIGLRALGLWPEQADLLAELLKAPQGMILVTGPTGSGKSTTLYAALNLLRTRTLNIITVEDPVEYGLEGVNQVQVNEKAGRTFASSLRSILRQDPNVIMVGEVRDSETAEISFRAAQTGHLVLSTLHTRDSIATITRLFDLQVAPYLVASTLTAVIAQRLVRKLCECRAEAPVSRHLVATWKDAGLEELPKQMYVPVGCPKCSQTGYRGRVGVYEMLVFNEQISEAVREGASELEIKRIASANGMRPIVEDALLKVNLGITTIDEVRRVLVLTRQSQPAALSPVHQAQD